MTSTPVPLGSRAEDTAECPVDRSCASESESSCGCGTTPPEKARANPRRRLAAVLLAVACAAACLAVPLAAGVAAAVSAAVTGQWLIAIGVVLASVGVLVVIRRRGQMC